MSVLIVFIINHVLSPWAIHIPDVKAGSCLAVLGWLSFYSDWGKIDIFEKPSSAFLLTKIIINFISILILIIFKVLFNNRISSELFLFLFSRKTPRVTFLSQLARWVLVLKDMLVNLPALWNSVLETSVHLLSCQESKRNYHPKVQSPSVRNLVSSCSPAS